VHCPSPRSGLSSIFVAISAVALLAPASAVAKDYCVNYPACVSGGGEAVGSNGAAIQTALTDAEAGEHNRVLIGAGEYARTGGFTYNGKALTVEGAGTGRTIISRDPEEGRTVVALDSSATVANLTVQIPESELGFPNSFMLGLYIGGGHATHIAVTAPGGSVNGSGVRMEGGSLTESTIETPRATAVESFGAGGKVADISDSTITGAFGVSSEGGAVTTVARCHVASGEFGFALSNYFGKLTVEDSLVDLGGLKGAVGQFVSGASAGNAESILQNVTIVNAGSLSRGLELEASSGHEAKAEVDDSILSEVSTPVREFVTEPGSVTGVTTNYSSVKAAGDEATAEKGAALPLLPVENHPASLVPGFLAPIFGEAFPFAGNWRLAPSSQLIDAGAPGGLAAGESTTDLAGNPRIVHGRRDVGAYEYQWHAPAVHAHASTTTPHVGEPVQFTGSAEPLEPGDAVVSYQWTFDDGTVVPAGATATHAYATPGAHTATLSATDSLGVIGTAVVHVTIPSPSGGGGHPTGPVLSGLHLSHHSFRVLGKHAKSKHSKGGKGGTLVTYELSEAATLTVTVQRRFHGFMHGRVCVAGAHKAKHGKRCTRYVTLPGQIVIAGQKGMGTFSFAGRVGNTKLPPGNYRLVVSARNQLGSSAPLYASFRIVR
jgi:hypothetical protein